MMTRFKARDRWTAQIAPLSDGYMLTVRDRRGKVFRRRRYPVYNDAVMAMWQLGAKWEQVRANG